MAISKMDLACETAVKVCGMDFTPFLPSYLRRLRWFLELVSKKKITFQPQNSEIVE
jgi:hypothetical protein